MDRRTILTHLRPLLRSNGFTRHGVTWNRLQGNKVGVINFQGAAFGGSFAINLGVCDPEVYSICHSKPVGKVVREVDCTVRERLGALISGDRDVWWEYADANAPAAVEAALVEQGLPWIESHFAADAMEATLSTSRDVKNAIWPEYEYWAILMARNGNPAGACAALRDYHRMHGEGWRARQAARIGSAGETQSRIVELMTRLGCELPVASPATG